MFRIKICGITNTPDALMAAEAGADAIGLNLFKKSRRFIDLETASQIAAEIPAGITKVGVFVNHEAAFVADAALRIGLDAVQLHGDEPAEFLGQLPGSVTVVRAFRCGSNGLADAGTYLNECRRLGRLPHAVLVDADAGSDFGGTGQLPDWALIARDRRMLADLPLILAGGLSPQNVAAAVAAVRPDAVDVASGVESVPGRKDRTLVASFFTAAHDALARL